MAKAPRVVYAILSDSHKQGVNAKIDAFGLFSWINVWGLPATRECSITIGLRDVPPGTTRFRLWHKAPGAEPKDIGHGDVATNERAAGLIMAERIPLRFTTSGVHQIGVGLDGGSARSIHWTPVEVRAQELAPHPAGADLAKLLADPHSIKSLRAELLCKKCSTRHVFELHLDPSAPLSRGTHAFPPSGRFKCPRCGSTHYTRDLEGQLRSHLGRRVPGPGE